MDRRRIFGNAGEKIAADYLKKKGYKILEKQFGNRFGEIDLIAKDGDEIVFVEVKTRKSLALGYPEESVHEKKLHRMEITADAYLKSKTSEDQAYRFDVIAIVDEGGVFDIKHIIGV